MRGSKRSDMAEDVRNKSYEELLSDLGSDRSTKVYRSLCLLKEGMIDERAFEPLKKITIAAKTFKNQKLAYALIRRCFPERAGSITLRTDANLGYIYFLREPVQGHIKIGRTRSMERRLRFFAKKLPFKVVPVYTFRSYNYEAIERELHIAYAQYRLKGEWFRLEEEEITAIIAGRLPTNIAGMIRPPNSAPLQQGAPVT